MKIRGVQTSLKNNYLILYNTSEIIREIIQLLKDNYNSYLIFYV